MNNGGGGRVRIPKKLEKTIHNIKEIAAGKHSDDDIYSMLKECNMDPNDTVQRLLYLDTFHEVKRKRDKKKVDVGGSSDDYRWSSSMQRRGARGGREIYSSNISEDSGGRRKGSFRQENGIGNYRGGNSRTPSTVVQKRENNAVPSISSPKNASVGLSYGTASQMSSGYISSSSVVSQAETVEPHGTKTSVDQTTQELDQKFENLSVSSHQSVIFPDHLQVPEALRRGLTFGSLDANSGVSVLMNENSSVSDLVGEEPSQSHHASPTDKEHDERAEPQETNPTAPSTSSGSNLPVTQPSELGQAFFALPPHLLPYLRQPYPSLFPYNPYYPHLFMPHAAHHFLGHNILPQQPTDGSVYASSAAAAGSKYAVPPMLKTSSVGGNMTHFGVPSGYGSFGASNVGYSSSHAFTSGSSSSTEDLVAAELKENNIYEATQKKNEEAHRWTTTTPGREISTLPTNYFYNIPPGQHVAFPSPHCTHGLPYPGVYHLNQAHCFPAPSSLQSFSQQPQAAGGTVESVVPSSQQPHS